MSSAKKKASQAVSREQVHHSLLYWAIMAFTVGFLLIAPFSKGLFQSSHNEFNYSIGIKFQDPINTALTFTFIALLILSCFYYFFFTIRQKTDYLLLLVWLIPLFYFIGIFRGVSVYSSLQGFYVQLMLVSFFLFGTVLVRYKKGIALLAGSMMASGYAVIVFGFMVWLGMYPNKGFVIIDGTGTRLSSVFTYANTYAGFLVALLLAMLYLSATSSKRWLTLVHAFFLVPALVSLLLTLSRGGWVLLPVLFFVLLPFVRVKTQLIMTAQLFVSGLAALLISSVSTNNGIKLLQKYDSGLMLKTLAILIGVSLLTALAALFIRYGAEKFFEQRTAVAKLRYSNLWFPIAVVIAGGLLLVLLIGTPLGHILPQDLQQRFANINFNQHSVRERGYFYFDSWKIAKDHLFFGTGSGGWTNLYHMYQSYPYTSRQAHNFLFQVLIDVGLVGLLLTFLFIGIIFFLHIRSFIKSRQENPVSLVFLIIAFGLLAHSFIDFDMSYAFMGALFYLCLGGMFGTSRLAEEEKAPVPQNFLNRYRWGYPGALGLLSLVMIVVSFQATLGSNRGMAALAELSSGQVNLDQMIKLLDQARSYQKSNIDYQLLEVDLYNQAFSQSKDAKYAEQGEAILKKLDRKEPNLIEPYEYRFTWAMQTGRQSDALAIAEEMQRRNPWNAVYYERAIGLLYQMGDTHWDQALNLYKEAQNRIAQQNKIPKAIAIANPLQITKAIALPVAQIHYRRGEYAEASQLLQPYLNESLADAQDLEVARYYAAAMLKQGNPDHTWYDKLIAKDANEKNRIDQLIQGNP